MWMILNEEKSLCILMGVLFLAGVAFLGIPGVEYGRMMKEAANMPDTKCNPLMQCKLEFASRYGLRGKAIHVEAFVESACHRMKWGNLSLEGMRRWAAFCVLLSQGVGGIAIFSCLARGGGVGEAWPIYLVCGAELYLYFSLSTVVDIGGKQKVLKAELVDYFSNQLLPKMQGEGEKTAPIGKTVNEVEAGRINEEEMKDIFEEVFGLFSE